MEMPRYGASDVLLEVLAAASVVFVALALLWPPRYVYWDSVGAIIGDQIALAFPPVIALGIGVWFGRTTALARRHVVMGAVVAYVVGMAAIEVVVQPESPVHLLWYGVVVCGLLAGVFVWEGFERYVASDSNG